MPTSGSSDQYAHALASGVCAGAKIPEGLGGKIGSGLAGGLKDQDAAQDGARFRKGGWGWLVWWAREEASVPRMALAI